MNLNLLANVGVIESNFLINVGVTEDIPFCFSEILDGVSLIKGEALSRVSLIPASDDEKIYVSVTNNLEYDFPTRYWQV